MATTKGGRGYHQRDQTLGYLLIVPAFLWLALLVAYPFFMAIYYSMSEVVLGGESTFVGLRNFQRLFQDEIFLRTVRNSFVYTISAVTLKAVAGLLLALLLKRVWKFKRLIRACILLPWVIPSALSALAWLWMYDSLYSVLTWTLNWFIRLQFLRYFGFSEDQIFDLMDRFNLMPLEINWLGHPGLAMASVIVVNTWVGLPFFAITLLAGLISISPEYYEAAEVDGAGVWAQFFHITLPLLKPVLAVVLLFSTIFTFADFNIVYVLTRGGPMNSTHLFATLTNAYAFESLQIGKGAAVSLFMFPILVIVVFFQLRYIRKE
ncbi:MAG: sugar ABC transporter permease [Nitrospinota bacterium]|nr:MAG: sugar ABC transporter permease [Nitrospinota bacterium]